MRARTKQKRDEVRCRATCLSSATFGELGVSDAEFFSSSEVVSPAVLDLECLRSESCTCVLSIGLRLLLSCGQSSRLD